MIYTAAIKKAIKFSIKTHEVYQKQKRKGKDVAYITHPLSVGLILSLAGAEENIIIAGILHDTIEDSVPEKKVTREMIEERFGKEVADLVQSVTEEDKSVDWEKRKKDAIECIKHYSRGSLLIKSADIISNMSELIDDWTRYGDEVFDRFYATKERLIEHYMKSIGCILPQWDENPLKDDLIRAKEGLENIPNK